MTAEEFKNKFIVNFRMDTKGVIAYINRLLQRIKTLEGARDGTN